MFLVLSFLSLSLAALNPSEYDAFLDIYNNMGGETWVNYYNTSTDPCTYVMVTCDMATSTTITKLRLGANNLTGTIHPSIGSFPNALVVNLASNHLTGAIPDSISNLTSIQTLDLSHNQLSGAITESLGSLLTLTELYLEYNQFTSLPTSITSLMKLTVLQADNNNLTGNMPSLSQWVMIQALFLDSNNFTGTISDFPVNSQMQTFSVSYNNFTGPIPDSVGNAQNMFSFFATNNSLSGTLPAALTQLPNLWMLYAAHNSLSGTLPEFASNVRLVYVGYNQFYGSIPASLFQLPNDSFVDFGVNHLNGTLPPSILNFPKFDFTCNAINSPYCPECGPCELCGDGFCDLLGGENCATCPQDCGAAPCGVCGDGVCQATVGETCSSCYIDCGLCSAPSKTCPGTPVCNGRGTCMSNLICSCNSGYTGPGCESTVQPITVGTGPGNPTTVITSSTGTSFEINIKQLTEYNVQGQVVKLVNFTNVPLNLTESDYINEDNVSLHNWTYSGNIMDLPGTPFVSVTVVLYRNATSVEFADQLFNLSAQTIKYTFAISDWPFASAHNTFGITFAAQDDGKGEVCLQSQKDVAGNVQWIKLILPSGEALYAEFTELVELDTKVIYGTFDAPQQGEVELIVPHFWNQLIFDPNFSLLVTDLKTSASECFKHKGIPGWAIALISVLGTFAVIAIILGSIYGYRKIKQIRQVKQARAAQTGETSDVGMQRV